jgi:hypothetical protein
MGVDNTPITVAQEVTVRSSGAGSLGDLARMAFRDGKSVTVTTQQAADFGAGFVQDVMRARRGGAPGGPVPTPPVVTHSAPCENISNKNPADIKVSSTDFPFYPVGTSVTFAGTGTPLLDNGGTFVVSSVNSVGKTFKVNADLSTVGAPISNKGTVNSLAATLLPVVPNGYEQWAADMAKEQEHGEESHQAK